MAKKKTKKVAKAVDKSVTSLDVAKKAIIKKYGNVLTTLGAEGITDIPTISSGSLGLDVALGRGGFARGRIYEIFGPPSGGKCQTEKTYLCTEHGLLTVKELFDLYNDPVHIVQKEVEHRCALRNEFGELETTSHFVWSGKRLTKKIITAAGFEAESTYHHRYRVIDVDTGFIVWKKTKDITIDDYLLLNRHGKNTVIDDMINEDEAIFLGMLISEGGLNYKNRTSFTNSDKEIIKLFSFLCNKLYNYTNIKYYNKTVSGNISLEEVNGTTDVHINSAEIRQQLYDNYGLDYVKAKDKTVPIKVRKSSNKIISKFLSAYFSLDGCYEKDGSITASSASKELLKQIQLLLLNNFGIKSTVNSKYNKVYDRDYYHLYLGDEDVVIFMKHIGFILQNKNDKFKDLDLDYKSINRSTIRWNFPYQNNILSALYKDVDGNRLSYDIIDKHINNIKRKLSQTKICEILEYFPKLSHSGTANFIFDHLKNLQHYICDKVESVQDIGEQPVFDFVMPKTHSFISNGLLSHNTTLTMSIIAEAQKRGLSAVFCDAEHSADPELFKAMGVDIDKLLLVKAFVGDDNLDTLETLLKTNEIDVAVVDSVSALIPKDEAESEMSDQFMGLLARLMSKAMRKFVPIVSETGTLMIFINQIRYKIGSWGDPTTTTGGEALTFYSTGRIEVSGGEFKKSRIPNPITGEIIGHNTKFEIKKNKLAPPFRTAKIPLIYGIGYDSVWECLTLAEGLGIIDKAGSWYSYKDEKIGQGELSVLNFLKENEDIYNEIREEIIDVTGLRKYYDLNK